MELDVYEEFVRLMFLITAKALFDVRVEEQAPELTEALGALSASFDKLLNPFARLFDKVPTPGNRRLHRAIDAFDEITDRILRERALDPRGRADALSLLLQAQQEGLMSDSQVHDEMKMMLLAGVENSSTALTWVWYLLSGHREVEKKLHAEIDSVLEGRAPRLDDLPKMKYTGQIFRETLRLFPPTWALGRKAVTDFYLDGYLVPSGSILIASQFLMHRDPRYFANPELFQPERWTEEFIRSLPKFVYFPFGAGPRLCMAESLAWLEALTIIAIIARSWRLKLKPNQVVVPWPRISLRPKNGMLMTVEKRS